MNKVANNIATIFLCLTWCSISFQDSARTTDASRKVIIDTDAGVDDATAILLILKSKGIEVLAITCTYGNTYVDNVVTNVLKTLTIADRGDIPVYKGAQRPFLNTYKPSNYFGSDGLGDFNFTEEITAHVDGSVHAALALLNLTKAYPGEITLLCIGPLTNVALAMTLDPLFTTYLEKLIILGSSVSGIGNVSPNVEFNFGQDPESNSIVLNRSDTVSILFPWETAKSSSIHMDWRANILGKLNSTAMNFLNKAERLSIANSTEWTPADAMAAAIMIWPELIEESTVTNVSPVTDGAARGSVLVDYTHLTGKSNNSEIVQCFNVTAFQDALLKHLS
ncbi:nucleoside hydrolase [Augochlora pura]